MRNPFCFLLLAATLAVCIFSPTYARAPARTVHVVVALCDNAHQGIVPVPSRLGDGDDPAGNLYWGAAYGVKTFMRKQAGWRSIRSEKTSGSILERIILRNEALNVTMVADAWQGKMIMNATAAFLAYASGQHAMKIALDGKTVRAGGHADLVVYVGHNGLMDFPRSALPPVRPSEPRPSAAAVFACQSKSYFADALREAGSRPLIWTRGNMAPEAYTLHALITAWGKGEKDEAVREAVARAYDAYQKCGLKGARNLFATGW